MNESGDKSTNDPGDENELSQSGAKRNPSAIADMFIEMAKRISNSLVQGKLRKTPDAKDLSEDVRHKLVTQLESFFSSPELQAAVTQAFQDVTGGKESEGKSADPTTSYAVQRILNHEAFMRWLLDYVPENSVWAIEGFLEEEQVEILQAYTIKDEVQVYRASIYPQLELLKIRLDSRSKQVILTHLDDLGIGWEMVHQHVYDDTFFYFSAYDHLTQVILSQVIPVEEIARLEQARILELSSSTGSQVS